MGEVLHLFTCLVHRFPMREVDEAEVIQIKDLMAAFTGVRGAIVRLR